MVLAKLKSVLSSGKDTERDRRSLPRFEETRATLVLDGASYPLIDWNPKGFQIAPYKGKLKAGSALKVRLIIPHKGQSFGFDLDAKVKRTNPHNNGVGDVFTYVDRGVAEKLNKLFAARLT